MSNGVRVIAQRKNWDCGVASLAMLLAKPYGDISAAARALYETLPPSKRGLDLHHLEEIAAHLGTPLARVYRGRTYLNGQTGILGMGGGSMNWAGHWVVYKAGSVIDPDDGSVWTLRDYTTKHKCRPATLLVKA